VILEQVSAGTGEIADERQAADFFHVPEEVNLLQAHGGHARRRADDQDRAAGPGTVGQELPKEVVGRVLRQAIHAHGGRHQGHVIHNGTDQADDQHDHILPPYRLIQPLRQRGQDVGVFQCGDRQQDADEEHDGTHVDATEGMHQGQVLLVFILLLAVNQVADQPENAQAEQDAHEGRQVGDGLESGNRDQDAEPHEEHQARFELGGGP
jgi:hypothetical protein